MFRGLRFSGLGMLTATVLAVACSGDESPSGGGTGDQAPNGSGAAGSGASSSGGSGGEGGSATGGSGGSMGVPDPIDIPVPALPECDESCTDDCKQGCFDWGACEAGALAVSFHENAHTLGIAWTVDEDYPADSVVAYRPEGFETWFLAHRASEISDGRAITSLFHLAPGTPYEVRIEGSEEVSCEKTETRPSVPAHETVEELFVDTNAAPGGDGSEGAPFKTISTAMAAAGPGTDVLVAPGVYRESVAASVSGTDGHFVRIIGDEGAIIDGSADSPALSWSNDGENVWKTSWDGDPRYLSRDGTRLYHFLTLQGLRDGIGDDAESIAEGFLVDGGELYVRSATDPSGHEFQIPELNVGIALDGVEFIWIEGLTIRHFGEGDYAKGIDVRESDHVVIQGNVIHDIPSPVWSRRGSQDIWVLDNEIYQTRSEDWPWAAVKGTDHENSAIALGGGAGAIVRNNVIHEIFNGIYTGSFSAATDATIAFDADVYANRLARIHDDGLEPEGAVVNNRFWLNTLDGLHNGISLAPVSEGPVWVIRNRFTDYAQGSFKVSNDSSGEVFVYHNSTWAGRADTNGMGQSGYFENMTFLNNIVVGTRYAIEMSQPHGASLLDYNNWYTTRGVPYIKWDNVRYDTSADWCTALSLECNGHNDDPVYVAPEASQLALSDDSPNIDGGMRIYGINDEYGGDAPDIGYLEFGEPEVAPLD